MSRLRVVLFVVPANNHSVTDQASGMYQDRIVFVRSTFCNWNLTRRVGRRKDGPIEREVCGSHPNLYIIYDVTKFIYTEPTLPFTNL